MTDKRDAVIEAWKKWEDEIDPDYSPHIRTSDLVADFTIQHASDVRRQIADELSVISDSRLTEYRLVQYIEKLRGNK